MTNPDELLTPAEVASLFRVNPKTVTRWARSGKLTAIKTLGGHRRFRQEEVLAVFSGNVEVAKESSPIELQETEDLIEPEVDTDHNQGVDTPVPTQ